MLDTLRRHWPEYLLEGFGLGLFMVSACGFTVLLFHPASPVPAALPGMFARGAVMGLAMGATALLNTYAPWGRRSGAHLNPVLTFTFWRLGKVQSVDLVGYVAGQFLGGAAGTGLAALLFHRWLSHPAVNFAVTLPGPQGRAVAFAAELGISFLLMLVVLQISNAPRYARLTGVFAAGLVALYIAFESPLSGMSMNPARTVASGAWAGNFTALWLYFTAPLAGMLLAAQVYLGLRGPRRVFCAKLDHDERYRCIFCHPHD